MFLGLQSVFIGFLLSQWFRNYDLLNFQRFRPTSKAPTEFFGRFLKYYLKFLLCVSSYGSHLYHLLLTSIRKKTKFPSSA